MEMNNLLSHLRLADLELFITAGHLKNLSKAASLHNLSQSAASAAIGRVELAFNTNLCTHEKRQFRLTNDGAQLLPEMEDWLRQFRERVATKAPRPLRVATTQAIARAVIAKILPEESIELKLMRPDLAYNAVLKDEADIALVPDNAPWEGLNSVEVGSGLFQLYSKLQEVAITPVLLPENQIEVLRLLQCWKQIHGKPLEIKARIPSWSLIADICANSNDVGFLPDFLGQKAKLNPVSWQCDPSSYRILALFHSFDVTFQKRLNFLVELCQRAFKVT